MRVSVMNANANQLASTGLRRYLTGLVSKSEVTDAALVSRFTADRDEHAFTELVHRLGPTVLGVCRRTLGAGPDADDAFQATFIVLARKAGTLQEPGQVGAWLYRVATLAALKARSQSRRRSMKEKTIDAFPEQLTPGLSSNPDAEAVIDEELARLPEQYRAPLVLCGIRGLSAKEAARELGCPVGTVHSRLSRGRAILARQLAGRGVCGCGVAAVVTVTMAARVSAEYVALALRGTTGQAIRHVIHIANTVLQTMAAYKLGVFLSAITCGGILLLGGLAYGHSQPVATGPVQPIVNVIRPSNDSLARMRLPALYPWLAQELVLKDLACDKAQREAIRKSLEVLRDAVYIDYFTKANEMATQSLESEGVAIRLVNPEETVKFDQTVLPLLRSDQLRRLKQLTLHSRGVDALLDRHVIRALTLSPEQEDQIEALLPSDRLSEPLHSNEVQTAEQFNSGLAAGLKLLTAEQRAKWFALVGKEAPGLDLAQGLGAALLDLPIAGRTKRTRAMLSTDESTVSIPGVDAVEQRK